MSDIRGRDVAGQPRDVSVSNLGDILASSRVFRTPLTRIPGIATASAYTAADAFGTAVRIPVPVWGTITNAWFLDKDDEGLDKELVLFSELFTATADHDEFAVSDDNMRNLVGIVVIDLWFNYSVNQIGTATPALSYYAPHGELFGQFVTRGADNIAAGALPEFFLVVT